LTLTLSFKLGPCGPCCQSTSTLKHIIIMTLRANEMQHHPYPA
jgi:hypothetical protein